MACSSTNASRIARDIHVLDAIGSFCEPLGLRQTAVVWDLPVPDEAREWARAQWPDDGAPTLVISPCSSHVLRNWRPERHAAVANHAAARGWRVVLCGGRSAAGTRYRRRHPCVDVASGAWTWSARTR